MRQIASPRKGKDFCTGRGEKKGKHGVLGKKSISSKGAMRVTKGKGGLIGGRKKKSVEQSKGGH